MKHLPKILLTFVAAILDLPFGADTTLSEEATAPMWAFAATAFNRLTTAGTTLAFRKGADDYHLVYCNIDRPAWATVQMEDGRREDVQLVDAEVGQLVTNYGRATGHQIELDPLLGYEKETEQAAAAGAGYPTGAGNHQ